MSDSQFLFATCQVGAEKAVKMELARAWPDFRFAYSRPGFLTFKLPPNHGLADDFDLRSVFARAHGFSLGKVTEATAGKCATAALQLLSSQRSTSGADEPVLFDRLHVWQRDPVEMGHHNFEPGPTPAVDEADQLLRVAVLTAGLLRPKKISERKAARLVTETDTELTSDKPSIHEAARPGELVLDCVLVEPNEWWLGYHRAKSVPSRWAGGIYICDLPEDVVSRAYLKMREALAWSRLPVRKNEIVVEIGSAPGGASQALLGKGLKVIGIDPAEMDPRVTADPKFTHWRKRGHDVRRREFRGVRWLTADINVAPAYTLDTVEDIVLHDATDVEGLLLTLKLPEWSLAEELHEYLRRIKSWGYRDLRARQLSHNRQEICVVAIHETRGKTGRSTKDK